MKKLTLFYVPFPNKDSALEMIQKLVERRLIACGNIVEAKSCYEWNGVVNHDDEIIAIMKTVAECKEDVERFLEENHPYDTPAILHWTAACNVAYYEWVVEQTQ